ncbi:MAG: hypothetical protein AAFW75_02285 [Cyanobacteria bacterium J06636_16]
MSDAQAQQKSDQRKQLETENQRLERQFQKSQQRVAELKQTVARLEQENRSLQKKLDRITEKQRSSEQPVKANKGMKTLAGQLEVKGGKAKQAERFTASESSSRAETAPKREKDPYHVDGDRLMKAYFGDRQDFSKKARGR